MDTEPMSASGVLISVSQVNACVVQISNHRALESLQGHHQQRLQGHQQQRLNKAIVEEYRKPQTNQSPVLHRPTRAVECTPSMPSWRRSD